MRWVLPITPGSPPATSSCSAAAGSVPPSPRWRAAPVGRWCGPPPSTSPTPTRRRSWTSTSPSRSPASRSPRPGPSGHVGDREILTVNAALGRATARRRAASGPRCPTSRRPDDCPTRMSRMPGARLDHGADRRAPGRRAELRRAAGPPSPAAGPRCGRGSPTCSTCPRPRSPSSATTCPFGIGQALGAQAGGNSLDNTLRVARLVPTEWVLLDIRIDAIANGFGHGVVHLWAEDGTLLATASQSHDRPLLAGRPKSPEN